MRIISFILLMTIFASCQSHNSRVIASTGWFRVFIERVAKTQNKTAQIVEREIIDYIKNKPKNSVYGHWDEIGILKKQADEITNLAADTPQMSRVRKWISENITRVTKISSSNASKIYAEVVLKYKPYKPNPYVLRSEITDEVMSFRQSSSPFNSIDDNAYITYKRLQNEVKDKTLRNKHKRTMAEFTKRAKSGSPKAAAIGNEVIDTSLNIHRITGMDSMGKGCAKFTQSASDDILVKMAEVNSKRLENVVELSAAKNNGKIVKNFKDIPSSKRLSQSELDDATIKALEDVMGYTRLEAQVAYKRLRKPPCEVF